MQDIADVGADCSQIHIVERKVQCAQGHVEEQVTARDMQGVRRVVAVVTEATVIAGQTPAWLA